MGGYVFQKHYLILQQPYKNAVMMIFQVNKLEHTGIINQFTHSQAANE